MCFVCICFHLCITQTKVTNVRSRRSCNFPFEMGILGLLFFYLYLLLFFLIRVEGTLETFSTAFEKLSGMIKVFSTYFFFKTTQGFQQTFVHVCHSLIPHIEYFPHTHAHDIHFVRHLP